MSHKRYYSLADPVVGHFNSTITGITDPFITSRLTGLVAVAAVTVYELCIKHIFYQFATSRNEIFGAFTLKYFERINGRVKVRNIKEDYLTKFGAIYVDNFGKNLALAEHKILTTSGKSIQSSYNNIIVWRNQFAHEGNFAATVTYPEAVESYNLGKEVVQVLADTLR